MAMSLCNLILSLHDLRHVARSFAIGGRSFPLGCLQTEQSSQEGLILSKGQPENAEQDSHFWVTRALRPLGYSRGRFLGRKLRMPYLGSKPRRLAAAKVMSNTLHHIRRMFKVAIEKLPQRRYCGYAAAAGTVSLGPKS